MKKLTRNIQLEQQIDALLKGKLSHMEIKYFVQGLLKHPWYIELLETELVLYYIVQHQSSASEARQPVQVEKV